MDKDNKTPEKSPCPQNSSARDNISNFGRELFTSSMDPDVVSEQILADLSEVPLNIFEDETETIPGAISEATRDVFFDAFQQVLPEIEPQLAEELIPDIEPIPVMELENSPLSETTSETQILFETLPEVTPIAETELGIKISPDLAIEIVPEIIPELEAEVEPQDTIKIEPDRATEIAPELASEEIPKIAIKTAPEHLTEIAPEHTSKSTPQHASESAPEVLLESTLEPIETSQKAAGGDNLSQDQISSSSNSDILIEPIFGEAPYYIPNKCQKMCSFEYEVHPEPSTSKKLAPKVIIKRRCTRKMTREEEIKKENYRKFQEEMDKIEVVVEEHTEKKKRVSKSPNPKEKKETKKVPPKTKKKQTESKKPNESAKRLNKRKQANPKKRTQ